MGEHFAPLEAECRRLAIPLVACSGEPVRDIVFERRSSTPAIVAQSSFEYLNHGGAINIGNVLRFLSDEVLGTEYGYDAPHSLAADGIYRPGSADALSVEEYWQGHAASEKPTAALLFYRAHWVSSNLEFVDAIVGAVEAQAPNRALDARLDQISWIAGHSPAPFRRARLADHSAVPQRRDLVLGVSDPGEDSVSVASQGR